ncbi:hypothetical protein EXS57_01080 [Candidatus Kaiserbacteria bacterium]|nr:hypothetical protein [Candidatus Kaiserbacteria bacterium]
MSRSKLWKTSITKISQLLLILVLGSVSLRVAYAGTLSCSVTTAAACTGGTNTVILRMSGTSNAHAELPSQANVNYASNVVCCSGVTGLGNACSGTFATALKLSGVTNAHVQQTGSYASNACISVPSGGSVSIGYQATNCTGFDTTLASMKTADNSHVGDTTAYTEFKICGTATDGSQSLTFSISDNSIGFGTLVSSGARYATGDTLGSGSDTVDAHTISVATNASSGYTMTLNGATLASGGNTVTAIGVTAVASSVGTEQFGARLIINSGTGSATVPYASANWALDTAAFPDQVASGAGDGVTTVFGVRYIGNISASTENGSYSSTLTYVATATF